MAELTKVVGCADPVSMEVLFKSILQKDSDNNFYMNMRIQEKTAETCDDYEPAVACGTDLSMEQIANKLIVLDDCGDAALSVLAFIETV